MVVKRRCIQYALIFADSACQPSSVGKPTFRQVRNWRHLDVKAFAADLQRSADDVNTPFNQYDSTLINQLDKHTPLRLHTAYQCTSIRSLVRPMTTSVVTLNERTDVPTSANGRVTGSLEWSISTPAQGCPRHGGKEAILPPIWARGNIFKPGGNHNTLFNITECNDPVSLFRPNGLL